MILSDLGLGAKTNVGYGKFSEFKRYVTEEERNEKYKNNPLANEFIELLQKGKKEKVEALVFNLEGLIKYKALEAFLKKYLQTSGALNEEQKQQLEAHLLGNMNDRIKRKKFPFGTIGNDKCLGREKANEIADKLGL